MAPVAFCNLETLLEKSESGAHPQPLLRSFFGCLASALGYLHDSSIHHKDVKPSNVLNKHDQVYLTDFGTCLDWSELNNSITSTAPPTTPRYC
ncbi:kinase-like domain-containing protein [Paraphoma chrysanthemicola]|nr:kinase-like domain-containing protein [Paraphoma chrysanthemicola]